MNSMPEKNLGAQPTVRWARAMNTARLTLVAAVSLSGCMVGPKYTKPVVPTYQAPDTYKDAYKETDPNWHAATPADAALRGDWWTIFHDDELSLLEVRAGLQNQSLKSAAARYEEGAGADRDQPG